jgi:adenine specific DNA methylase Mod
MPRTSPRGQQRLFEKRLFYGDNLRILRLPEHFSPETVDLVYLDPPFKPNEKYNVLFQDRQTAVPSASQVRAFEDTWRWGPAARDAFNDVKENAPHDVRKSLEALHAILGFSNMFAYLAMMAPRLVELRTVMKPTASIYLHCDPAASHYLKVLMDAVFGPAQFRNEIIWKRTSAHGSSRRWGPVHDVLLFYTKGETYTWNAVTQPYDSSYLDTKYRNEDERGPYMSDNLTGAGLRGGDSGKPWREYDPSSIGRHWAVPSSLLAQIADPDAEAVTTQEKLDLLDAHGLILWPSPKKAGTSFPRVKTYRGLGVPIQDVVADISPINSQARERLHYPTQKPIPLLERIIQASSVPGELVLDPFCGCGTTIEAAESLGRQWVGVDVSYDAIPIIRSRLALRGLEDQRDYEVWGLPETVADAERLAEENKYQFQWWAVRRLGAREADFKKGADKGVDGRLVLPGNAAGHFPEAVISVKAGKTGPVHVRELAGTVRAQGADVGVLVVLKQPTKAMSEAAAEAGEYLGEDGKWYARVQVLTAAEVIAGKGVEYPPAAVPTRERRSAPSRRQTP